MGKNPTYITIWRWRGIHNTTPNKQQQPATTTTKNIRTNPYETVRELFPPKYSRRAVNDQQPTIYYVYTDLPLLGYYCCLLLLIYVYIYTCI